MTAKMTEYSVISILSVFLNKKKTNFRRQIYDFGTGVYLKVPYIQNNDDGHE